MNYLKAAVRLGLFAGLLGVSQAGWACWLFGTYARGGIVNSYTLPPTPIVIDREGRPGPQGGEIVIQGGSAVASVGMRYPSTCLLHTRYSTPMEESGYEDGVYKTNVPGIGFKIYEGNPSRTIRNHWVLLYTWNFPMPAGGEPLDGSGAAGFRNFYRLKFYITGPVSPGEVNFFTTIQGKVDNSIYQTLTIQGTLPIIRGGCRTPDIHVNLKSHSSASFPKLWATSPETPFDFQLNECEPGMNAVSYTFKPATGVTLQNAGNSVYQRLTLSRSSTAKNVAVQVMNADGSMVKFNEKIKFTGYNKATGGSYRIPMKARYMRTGNITNGTANSAMEFIMHYE